MATATKPITIRILEPEDGPLLKSIFLEMLIDSPDVFGGTPADYIDLPASFWDDLAERWSSPFGSEIAYLVTEDGRTFAHGAGVMTEKFGHPMLEIMSMYTPPALRARGAATEILRNLINWGRAHRAITAYLWVAEGNALARHLYEKMGFRLQPDDRRPMREGSDRYESRMVLAL